MKLRDEVKTLRESLEYVERERKGMYRLFSLALKKCGGELTIDQMELDAEYGYSVEVKIDKERGERKYKILP